MMSARRIICLLFFRLAISC